MQRLNTRGELLSGNGGAVSVLTLGQKPDEARVLADRGTVAQWWNDDKAIYQCVRDDVWIIELADLRQGVAQMLVPRGCNELSAHEGRWMAFLAGYGLFGNAVTNPDDEEGVYRDAGLSPVGTDGRGPMADDGTIGLTAYRQGPGPVELVPPGGTLGAHNNTRIFPSPYGLYILDENRAVWNEGAAIGMPSPTLLPGALRLRRVVANSQVWWIYWSNYVGLVAHPDNDLEHGHWIAAAAAFHHDVAVLPDGRLIVGYSTGVQELPAEGRLVDVWTLPVVNLLTLQNPVIDPPVDPPVDPPIVVVPPDPPVEPPMSVKLSREQFVAMCEDVAAECTAYLEPPIPDDLVQGPIQIGDKFRKPKSEGGLYERDGSAQELSNGCFLRQNHAGIDDTKVQEIFEKMAAVDHKYGLR